MRKNVLIGISGSIAAYKMADVVSGLGKLGYAVKCILTDSAQQFVTPLVLETLSGNKVETRLFGDDVSGTEHITLARWADLYVIAPASANALARLALGLADDLLTTVALATRAPMLVAPAMNTVMWEQGVVQEHIATLKARGATFIEPATGTLACGEEGAGKLATVEAMLAAITAALADAGPGDLAGKTVLITAGPTTTPIDAVRYITNHSTGTMGAAMAEEALRRGASVRYVLGMDKGVVRPVAPRGTEARLKVTEVRTAADMRDAALAALPDADGVVASAAVMDYEVAAPASGKLKRATEAVSLSLSPSPDVLAALREAARPGQWFLGFAAETDDVEANGRGKLERKRLDFLFANQVARVGEKTATGFGRGTNGGVFLRRDGSAVTLAVQEKGALARAIWDEVVRG